MKRREEKINHWRSKAEMKGAAKLAAAACASGESKTAAKLAFMSKYIWRGVFVHHRAINKSGGWRMPCEESNA